MGYYTNYNLSVKNVRSNDEFMVLQAVLRQKCIINYALDDGEYNSKTHNAEFYSYDMVKWYEHDKDMIEISKLIPHMTFMLAGNGENYEDQYRIYYKDGESEYTEAEIVWSEPQTIKWEDADNSPGDNAENSNVWMETINDTRNEKPLRWKW